MKIGFSLFLALRYLKPKRTFLSAITFISVLGVTLGITVLILVMSVMRGFDLELRRKVIAFDAHLVVSNGRVMDDWREVAEKIKQTPGVVDLAPFVQGQVIAQFNNQRLAATIRGIEPDQESKISDIRRFIKKGQLDLSEDNAVIGSELAKSLKISVGDTITISAPGNLKNVMTQIDQLKSNDTDSNKIHELKEMVLPATLKVTGIFESGRYFYDSEFILVPLHIGQELYLLEDGIHGLSIKTVDPYKAEAIKNLLSPKLGPDISVMTWIDLNRQAFDLIRMQRSMLFFLLLFIVIVAAFGIMNTLITVTVQKTREIGVMKALGAKSWQIIGIFLGQGIVVGIFGTLLGLLLGMTLIQYRNEVRDTLAAVLHIRVFPPEIYQFSKIPAEVVPSDIMGICLSAFLICSIAALIPAWFATRLDPVKALRYE